MLLLMLTEKKKSGKLSEKHMAEKMLQFTSYLFSKASFLTGIGRIFDFSGSYERYNVSRTEKEADEKAMYLDWVAVGEDIRAALGEYGRKK